MLKFQRNIGRKSIVITSALLLSVSLARAEPNAMADCAKMDLLLLTLIEDAGIRQSVNPQFLLRAVGRIMTARQLCERGDAVLATETYRRLVVNLSDRQD